MEIVIYDVQVVPTVGGNGIKAILNRRAFCVTVG